MKSYSIKKKKMPLRVMFSGWTLVPHSYAIVNCFQLIHLYKNYGPDGKIKKDAIEIYVDEFEYFKKEWNEKKKLVYTVEYNNIIKGLKKYTGTEEVDLIYRITFPYNITVTNENITIPKCVFYTSEFREYLTKDYFLIAKPDNYSDEYITRYLNEFKNIFFTSPSEWSHKGMEKYCSRNKVITHGVDPSIFYRDKTKRQEIRVRYNVNDNDILMMCVGAMTTNKGILLILQLMYILVYKMGKKNIKLLLKGTGDLYECKKMLESYTKLLVDNGMVEMDTLYETNCIFTESTLSFANMNQLYNASDVYISPYLAEGFGLTILEALTAGLDVIVPKTGSTKEYLEDIYDNGGESYIHYIESKVVSPNGMSQNDISMDSLIKTVLEFESRKIKEETYEKYREYIENNYSWDKVSELLYNYFNEIIMMT